MSEIEPIIHQGRVAALVVAGQAIIPDALSSQEQTTVTAMCLYALEVAEGRLPGPYSDARARVRARRGGQAQFRVLKLALEPVRAPLTVQHMTQARLRARRSRNFFSLWQGAFGRRPGTYEVEAQRRKGAGQR